VKQVGFIETGGMGSGMAANLTKAGFGLVVNDVRREVARPLEERGAVFKDTAREVAESCELVLSMLPYGAAVREVAREMEIPVPFTSLVDQMFAIAQANGVDGYEATGIACEVFAVLSGRKER
jgi:3-hydroxyisobutyrate dehydrogenase-like beta-hydroxyacid dehydrogenase